MPLACLLLDDSPVTADLHGISTVALVGCHELDPAVAVPVVVPVHKRCHPLAGSLHASKWPPGVIGPVFCCAEKRFGIRVVVAEARPRERPEHAQFLKPALQRGRSHGVAVVGMEDQRLPAHLADTFAQAGPAHQIRSDGWILALGDIPGHHLSAPDVDPQVEVQPHTAHGSGEIGDVPAPNLIVPCGPQAWNRPGLLWWPGQTPAVAGPDRGGGLAHGRTTPVKSSAPNRYKARDRPERARSGPAAAPQIRARCR